MAETTETRVRSRRRGFKDVYVAKVTKNTEAEYTTDIPVKLGKGISAKVSDKFTSDKIFGDDAVEEVVNSYEGSEIELELNTLAPQDRRDLLDNLYENGFLVKSGEDTPPEVAIGWCAKKGNGRYEFVWYYCGKFAEGIEDTYETQEDKIKTQTNKLKGTFYARNKEVAIGEKKRKPYSIVVDEENLITEYVSAKASIDAWFKSVQEFTPDNQTP